MSTHKPTSIDEEDPVVRMIKNTGCLEQHYKVQECFFDKQDWRKCQQEVKDFKDCMRKSAIKKKGS